jgi:asparagine synthase (glutamine-hydrolysing)
VDASESRNLAPDPSQVGKSRGLSDKLRWRLDFGGWLRNELREFALDHLQGRSSVTRHYYDAAALDRVLDEHLKGKKNHETLLWTLLNLEIWHRTYRPG